MLFANQNKRFENARYGRGFTELMKILSEGISTKLWFEYLPNFTVGSDYQMNSELSITAALNNMFAIKTGQANWSGI